MPATWHAHRTEPRSTPAPTPRSARGQAGCVMSRVAAQPCRHRCPRHAVRERIRRRYPRLPQPRLKADTPRSRSAGSLDPRACCYYDRTSQLSSTPWFRHHSQLLAPVYQHGRPTPPAHPPPSATSPLMTPPVTMPTVPSQAAHTSHGRHRDLCDEWPGQTTTKNGMHATRRRVRCCGSPRIRLTHVSGSTAVRPVHCPQRHHSSTVPRYCVVYPNPASRSEIRFPRLERSIAWGCGLGLVVRSARGRVPVDSKSFHPFAPSYKRLQGCVVDPSGGSRRAPRPGHPRPCPGQATTDHPVSRCRMRRPRAGLQTRGTVRAIRTHTR